MNKDLEVLYKNIKNNSINNDKAIIKLKEIINDKNQRLKEVVKVNKDEDSENKVYEKLKLDVLKVVSNILDVNICELDIDTELKDYGIDDIKLNLILEELNNIYSISINEFIVYESITINKIIDSLLKIISKKDYTPNNDTMNKEIENVVKEKTINYIKKLISTITKVSVNSMREGTSFDKYGIDSIKIMRLINILEKDFGVLPKTLFFEYKNIKELAVYFIENHNSKLKEIFNISEQRENQSILLSPKWIEKNIQNNLVSNYDERLVIFCGISNISSMDIPESINYMNLNNDKNNVGETYEEHTLNIFREVKKLLMNNSKSILIQLVINSCEENQLYEGLFSLLEVAKKENPKISNQLIVIEEEKSTNEIINIVNKNSLDACNDEYVKYNSNKRYVRLWKKVDENSVENTIWKDNGVYLITGGAGALGLIFAQEVVKKCNNVTLILVGRSNLSDNNIERIKRLNESVSCVKYVKVDVSNESEVNTLIENILKEFKNLNGIIHSAGIIKDNFIIKKSEEEFTNVINPKVLGTVNLDRASKNINLDFFMLFSSIAGSLGNIGQADYAVANAFLDRYSYYRNGLVKNNKRYGKTISINWPLWKSGGMKIDKETEKFINKSTNIIPMDVNIGVESLYKIFNSNNNQVMIINSEYGKLKNTMEYLKIKYEVSSNSNDNSGRVYDREKIIQKNTLNKEEVTIKDSVKIDLSDNDHKSVNDIAIIGMSGRYPGSDDLNEFWKNLKEGVDCITEIPKSRWDYSKYYDKERNKYGKMYSKWGGFISGVDEFDPLFFNISPKEAEKMDPQERLFLECVYETIENAGYTRDSLGKSSNRNVGIFVGVMYNDYQLYGVRNDIQANPMIVNASSATIANRISYFFNFKGPSIAIDTMCSSSLTSVHLACQSLRDGDCKTAVAGGVNVTIHPNKYLALSEGNFMSSNGKCTSFGEGGDGYVPGEGVGAILLKQLDKAIEDKDNIYGIIKGTAINHGGRTNGYTVPSPQAQSEVIMKAIKQAKIDPATISYIEAHGTGTALGDPIEIEGISKVLKGYNHCSIGSVKSNIGHCESAAGVAGITKILLQLKYKQLVPSLHSKVINENINLDKSNLVIQQKLEKWERPKISIDGVEQEVPRRAGVSAFGAGGSNAHIIIEEYIKSEESKKEKKEKRDSLILLSAKSRESLNRQVTRLLDVIKNRNLSNDDIPSIAYMLQVGREAMEERLFMVVENMDDLIFKLNNYINGINDDIYVCKIKQNNMLSDIFNDEDMEVATTKWLEKNKISKLGKLWLNGVDIDWKSLYKDNKPEYIDLPTYPFAKEKYWISDTSFEVECKFDDVRKNIIHPLLHKNTSDLSVQRYTTKFTGNEFFLRDHRVNKKKVLPGAVYLEMARAAVNDSLRNQINEDVSIELCDVVWPRPFVVNEKAEELSIELKLIEEDKLQYEIINYENKDKLVYSEGIARINKSVSKFNIDIDEIKKCCNKVILKNTCYEIFSKGGIVYGNTHRCIDKLYVGKDKVLAKLSLPNELQQDKNGYLLHTSMIDGAIQSLVGFSIESNNIGIELPFAFESMQIFNKTESNMWAIIEAKEGKHKILLTNSKGDISIQINGFISKVFKDKEDINKKEEHDEIKSNMLYPVWKEVELKAEGNNGVNDLCNDVLVIDNEEKYICDIERKYSNDISCEITIEDTIESIKNKLLSLSEFDSVFWIANYTNIEEIKKNIDVSVEEILKLFRFIKAVIELGYGEKNIKWTFITTEAQAVFDSDKPDPIQAAIHGLIGSVSKEYANWDIKIYDMKKDIINLPDEVFSIKSCEKIDLFYRKNKWYSKYLEKINCSNINYNDEKLIYKKNGVYVIIGGAGGIGQVYSYYLIEKYEANIVWIGRKNKNELDEIIIENIDKSNGKITYISADAKSREELSVAYEKIKEKYENINGVIHSAIVLSDNVISKIDEKEFKEVFKTKADISINIEKVFEKESLDFMLFFSSLQSFDRLAGQGNYAAGSVFEDTFAKILNANKPYKVRIINWGYFSNMGIVSSEAYKELMKSMGIIGIEFDDARKIIDLVLSSDIEQVAYIKTLNDTRLNNVDYEEELLLYQENIVADTESFSTDVCNDSYKVSDDIINTKDVMAKVSGCIEDILLLQLENVKVIQKGEINIYKVFEDNIIIEKYFRWLKEVLYQLEKKEILSKCYETYSLNTHMNEGKKEVWSKWESVKSEIVKGTSLEYDITLIDSILKSLPDILTGKINATDIIFGDYSMSSLRGIYKDNKIANYFNSNLADIVVKYIENRISKDSNTKIRIIEIGAGTGGTTDVLCEKLTPYKKYVEEYLYTDISKAFLLYGQNQYGQNAEYLKFKLFNVEDNPSMQNIDKEYYDLVIATNVIHATKDIRNSLSNIKYVMKNNGLLLLNELIEKSLWLDLTFGLLDGWWGYEDNEIRIEGSPILDMNSWKDILQFEGFKNVSYPLKEGKELGQQIILAQSDGIVPINLLKTYGNDKKKYIEINVMEKNKLDEELCHQTKQINKNDCINYLKEVVGKVLKIPVERIDADEELVNYGVDSIIIIQITKELKKTFSSISSTIFFECNNIDEMSRYLLRNNKAEFNDRVIINEKKHSVSVNLNRDENMGLNLHSRQMLKTIEQSKEKIISDKKEINKDVAIIGISGLFPGSKNVDEFWENLEKNKNVIIEVPRERWNWEEYKKNKNNGRVVCSRYGGFIENFNTFDVSLFNISPKEAERIDPQERKFLEVVYSSIEDAGYTSKNLCESKKVGVFVGAMNADYISGAAYWSIANRISYAMNFQGPSMAIDSACSSSLTALHLALESIYTNTSECCIVGGVNLIQNPKHLGKLSSMHMLSKDDKCKSFGEGADGFVDSESIVSLVLKPLNKAVEDGDHIYGVIKGSMINSGGKTSGYTVPNPEAQYKVIKECYDRSNINPRTVSYIEAHGTGTKLGDPIEVSSLTRAFKEYTDDREFCSIGSVKSNMGHSESASGMVGIVKVLLMLKNKELIASINSDIVNYEIDFEKTPFFIQHENEVWKETVVEENGVIQKYPRRAGISSFGAGGANAHVIIEEYIDKEESNDILNYGEDNVVLLSDKNKSKLIEKVKALESFIKENNISNNQFTNLAYTLQVGRDEMEERLCIVANSIDDLCSKMEDYINMNNSNMNNLTNGIYMGEVSYKTNSTEGLKDDVEGLISKRDYHKIAKLWTKGVNIHWKSLYKNKKVKRISLPGYCFEKKSYWFEDDIKNTHPLLNRDISEFNNFKFKSDFNGEEFFIKDHIVNGEKILPAAAYIEISRAAINNVLDNSINNNCYLCINNITLDNKFVKKKESESINIRINQKGEKCFYYEIYSESNVNNVLYSKGNAELKDIKGIDEVLNLEEIKNSCKRKILEVNKFYDKFEKLGIKYGTSMRGIKKLYVGDAVLSQIVVPKEAIYNVDKYCINPCILDSAIQSILALGFENDDSSPAIPYEIFQVEIFGECSNNMWSIVRHSNEKSNRKFDIDICDNNGKVKIKIKGLTMFYTDILLGNKENVLLEPVWEKSIGIKEDNKYDKEIAIFYDCPSSIYKKIQINTDNFYKYSLENNKDSISNSFKMNSLKIFKIVKSILNEKKYEKILLQVVDTKSNINESILGLLKTAQLENPKLIIQFIEIEKYLSAEDIERKLIENSCYPKESSISYINEKRYIKKFKEINRESSDETIPWKDNGVYLITGGCGKLGLLLANEIVSNVKKSNIILVGRSKFNESVNSEINKLKVNNSKVVYYQADISNRNEVDLVIENAVSKFGKIDGIINSAGIIKDNFIINKVEEEFLDVIKTKVDGLVNLDESTKEMELDFFVGFSSLSAVFGNIGQSDYSLANAFTDNYLIFRDKMVNENKRHGKSISINWPIWSDGGMHIGKHLVKAAKNIGIDPIDNERGIKLLKVCINGDNSNVIVLYGDAQKIRNNFFIHSGEDINRNIHPEESSDIDYLLKISRMISEGELSEEDFLKKISSMKGEKCI